MFAIDHNEVVPGNTKYFHLAEKLTDDDRPEDAMTIIELSPGCVGPHGESPLRQSTSGTLLGRFAASPTARRRHASSYIANLVEVPINLTTRLTDSCANCSMATMAAGGGVPTA